MKNGRIKKAAGIVDLPKYKLMIPCILCISMILLLFIKGIDNKTIVLGVMSVCMVAWFIGERIFPDKVYKDNFQSHNIYIYIFTGLFLVMMFLSEICANDYSSSKLIGEHDSVIALLGYIIMFYMAYRYCYMSKSQKMVERAIVIVAVVTAVMSTIEFLDISIAELWIGSIEELSARNRVILTFGNSNYYGAFCCMLLPFIMELWLHACDKVKKFLLSILNGGLICCVMMSKSTLALYLMIIISVIVCLYELKAVVKQWGNLLCVIATMILCVAILNFFSTGKMVELVKVGIGNNDAFDEISSEIYEVEDIHIEGNRLTIEGTENSFVMEYDDSFTFYDGDGNILDIENRDNTVTFTEAPYDAITISVSYNQLVGMLYIEIDMGYKETIDFYLCEGEFKGVGADGGAVEDIGGEYKNHKINSLFTGRGYIWINTVSMLDEVVFIGKGCGNFVHNFKQYDYVGLLKSQGTHNVIIDRPHNMFLQYSIDIGIVGTVSLFALIVYIFVGWIKQRFIYGRDDNVLSVASFMAVVAFIVFAMLNDSLVVLSPYMWVFLGMNMSVQSKIKA